MRLRFWKRKSEGKILNLSSLQIKPDCKYVIFYDRRVVPRKELAEALGMLGLRDDEVRIVGIHGVPKPAIATLEIL